MKNNILTKRGRVVSLLCALWLLAVLFFPIWQIQLAAPQYPEGLILLIYPGGLGGNVDIINGLNHYIGMKTLHSADFLEFTLLPYIIGFFSLSLLLTAWVAKRSWLNILFTLFVVFGIVAMVDFWKWEYNYGHNLNPDAAIIVPGMAYQPPLIGFKQLLNFGAYSIPDTGGWIFIGVGILLFLLVVSEARANRKKAIAAGQFSAPAMALLLLFFSSCHTPPEPIRAGKDNCFYCKMMVSDVRFGAELITQKGRVQKFDDIHCLKSYLKEAPGDKGQGAEIYFQDFCDGNQLLPAKAMYLLNSDSLRGPMGGRVVAFSNRDSMQKTAREFHGSEINLAQLFQP